MGTEFVNDLLFIPNNGSDIRFSAITGTTPFTEAQQQAAFEAYIKQDPYLSTRRGMLNAMVYFTDAT
jgi:hypothetical protein